MKTQELLPIYSSQKSFYRRAYVNVLDDGTKELYSYNTLVARLSEEKGFEYLWWTWSATTARHINEFLQQNGYPKLTKKTMLGYAINDIY